MDWILGDDPSQVVIPGSPPLRVDTPACGIHPDSVEIGHIALETIEEQEETMSIRATQKISSVNTWPRMRQTLRDRPPIEDIAASINSVFSGVDSGVYKSGSEAGLSTATKDSILPKISQHPLTKLEKGTQTEFSAVEVHGTVKGGRT